MTPAEAQARIAVLEGHRNDWRRRAFRYRDAIEAFLESWDEWAINDDTADHDDALVVAAEALRAAIAESEEEVRA